MSDRSVAIGWLTWLGSGALLVVTTRNPFFLAIVLLSAAAIFLTRRGGSAAANAWATVVKIGLSISLLNVAFNLLTVHAGDRLLATLPRAVPIVGGPLTFNALIYGLDTSLAIAALLLLAASFNANVDRLALVRLLPASLSSAGVAALVALSFFPQTLRTLSEVRQAQAARGFKVRRPRDLRVIIVPVLHLSLEHAFDLAETLESRGFGARRGSHSPGWLIPAGMTSLVAGAAFVAMSETWAGAAGVLLGVALIAAALRPAAESTVRDRVRLSEFRVTADLVLVAASLVSAALTVAALVAAPGTLDWSPYPTLVWPALAPLPSLAAALLAAPLAIEALA